MASSKKRRLDYNKKWIASRRQIINLRKQTSSDEDWSEDSDLTLTTVACHEVSQTDINLDEVSRKDPQDHRDITQFIQTEQSEIENVEQNTKLIWDYVDQHVLISMTHLHKFA